MPRMFIKLQDGDDQFYLEWSTISDAPNSQVVKCEISAREMYRQLGYSNEEEDFKCLEETGVSSPHYTLEELLECSDDFDTEEKLLEFCRTFAK